MASENIPITVLEPPKGWQSIDVKELSDSSCDFVVCSQLIEHVDDKKLLSEIKRLLRKRGLAYISSVVKSKYAIYLYFRNSSFRLDPTHIREYASVDEFASLLSSEGFDILDIQIEKIAYPVSDLIVRLFIRAGLVEPNSKFYHKQNLNIVRKLRVPIIGFYSVGALVRKKY